MVGLPVVAAGCFSVLNRDPSRCNQEFPDCASGLVCNLATSMCITVDGGLPDGFIGVDGGDMATGMCTRSDECPADAPICGAGMCRKCMNNADDFECGRHSADTPRCDTSSGKCAACRQDTAATDCKDPTPICDTTLVCRKCDRHEDCTATGICKPNGACASSFEVATVNKGTTCDNGAGNPYCEISPAVASGKPYVRVMGLAAGTYNAVSIGAVGSVTVTIVGPGRAAANKAVISQAGSTAVAVNSTVIGTTSVTLDGLDMMGSNGGTKFPGVSCNETAGTASVTIRDSAIHDSGQAGVDSVRCDLVVDRTVVGPNNMGGGIKVTDSVYTLTNSIIYNNSISGTRGLSLDDTSTGTAAFLTIAGNGSGAAAEAGVGCGLGTVKVISSSIVVDNNKGAGGSQFIGMCSLMNVVTGTDTFANAITQMPAMTSDYHLAAMPANDACCVDKADMPASPNRDYDIDRAKRPKGMRWDYGAHELK
jgi:hypothetical protein